jgi:hypothetical protein
MAQAVSRSPRTDQVRVRAHVSPCGFCGGQVALGRVSPSSSVFLLLVITPPLLHTQLTPPHDVCDSPEQATHYHTIGQKLTALSLTRHLVGLRPKQ